MLADAVQLLEALRLHPEDAVLACDLADAFAAKGQLTKAVLTYRHSLSHAPGFARAWYGCGCAEIAQEQFHAALESFQHAVELEPHWLEARHNLGRALYELGHVSEAFAQFTRCGETGGAGSEYSRAMAALIAPGVPEIDQAGILAARRAWVERDLPLGTGLDVRRRVSEPLRVGYVSSFFHRDNWMKPVWGLIQQHDPAQVRPILFSDGPLKSEIEYVDTSRLSNDEMAAMIAERGIDILVDLNGYSNMRRLPMFARRIAPVMVGWFNMYATTGMSSFDYLIGDSEVSPPEEERFYCETILRVPGSYLTFDVTYPVPPVGERDESGMMFGAMTSAYKVTDEVIAVWSRILNATPASRLLVKNKQLGSAGGREYLQARFAKYGIGRDRLELEGPEDHFDFLKAYDRVDVALDTFPYNGGTTTTEAIWQGVPVITFYGDRWASRTSASILRAANLDEFVAADVEGYIALATNLNPELLRELRRNMRARLQESSVCDTRGFARHMEELYRLMTTEPIN